MFKRESINLTTQGKPIIIHAISTGSISIKEKFREARRIGISARLDFLLDKNYTEKLPIWVWVIEHPDGIFIVDTGENSDVTKKGYFKPTGIINNWLNITMSKFEVDRSDDIDRQLAGINIPVDRIKAVILTHLHLDHTDGLKYFPKTDIIVNKIEWEKPFGIFPQLFPTWFKPKGVDLNIKFKAFDNAAFLTKSKDLIFIHTPGHTHGHSSVLLKTDDCYIFFAGDLCYYQNQIVNDKYSGLNVNYPKAKKSYNILRQFAKENKVVLLPSHDSQSGTRLRNLTPI